MNTFNSSLNNSQVEIDFKLPDYDSLDGLFLALLFKGHKMNYLRWSELTGRQFANQRAYNVYQLGVPVKAPKYHVPWSRNRIAVYQLENDFIEQNKAIAVRFIEKVERNYSDEETIKKGFESDPKPLKSILAGKLELGL